MRFCPHCESSEPPRAPQAPPLPSNFEFTSDFSDVSGHTLKNTDCGSVHIIDTDEIKIANDTWDRTLWLVCSVWILFIIMIAIAFSWDKKIYKWVCHLKHRYWND